MAMQKHVFYLGMGRSELSADALAMKDCKRFKIIPHDLWGSCRLKIFPSGLLPVVDPRVL